MEEMYKAEKEVPEFFWDIFTKQRLGLIDLQKKLGKEQIAPAELS